MRITIWFAVFAAALALRLPSLADRPMHADEAVLADKFGGLLETGSYQYNPREYHGPLMAWLTVVPARLAGARRYADLTEPMLRIVPVLCGLALVLSPLLLSRMMGVREAIAAAALTAVSPAMVYYSRYYIPEMLLTTLAFSVIVFGYRYAHGGAPGWALAAGAALGLMFVTKETAVITAAALVLACVATVRKRPPEFWPLIAGLAIAVSIPLAMLGPKTCALALAAYVQRGVQGGVHSHPWYYYVVLLGKGEVPILLFAVLGFAARSRKARFLAVYAGAMAFAYSLIPYKTPWCLLAFLQPAIVLAGFGVAACERRRSSLVFAAAGLILLGFQAWRFAFPQASDPGNPYVYAHTSRDVYAIRDVVDRFGPGVKLQVVSARNMWPLPWYLRSHPHIEWWRALGPDFRPSSLVLLTPEMEPALIHYLYEVPPPGQRELYVPVFDRYTELRPGTEVRGYAAASLHQ